MPSGALLGTRFVAAGSGAGVVIGMGAGVTAAATLSLIACAIAWGRAAASMGVFAWACRCFGARARLQSGDDFGLQWLARVLLDGMHSTLIAPLG